MRKQHGDTKWKLHLLLCVGLFSLSSSAANIPNSLSVFKSKDTGVKPPPAEDEPLLQQLLQSDDQDLHKEDVSVACGSTELMLRVRPAFYGLGADSSELRLGGSCRSTDVLGPDLLFKYPLTACGSEAQMLPDYLLYKFALHYEPSPKRQAHPVTVDIECRFPRNHHIHKLAIQPTWESHILHKTLRANQANFQIQLMDDTWEAPVQYRVFQLGETLNFQVSALDLPHGQKLFVQSCYAIPIKQHNSPIRFTVIDNFGCLLDSKIDPGASQFTSRTDETVRFSIEAFQFVTDPETEISLHCTLDVTAAGFSPAHKSCTYDFDFNRWVALSGDDAVCECCDFECETSKEHRAMMDGIISSGPLWVSSHSEASGLNENDGHRKQNTTEKASELVHQREMEIMKHREDTAVGMEELKWPTHEDQKVKVVESKAHKLDLLQQNFPPELLGYHRLKPLKENAELLVLDGEKESVKSTDGNMKTEIKEIVEQENSGDESDWKTWYFAWK